MRRRKKPALPTVIVLEDFTHNGKNVRRAQEFTVEFLPEGQIFTVRLWHLTSFYVLRMGLLKFAELQDQGVLAVSGEAPKPERVTIPASEQYQAAKAREDAIIDNVLKRRKRQA